MRWRKGKAKILSLLALLSFAAVLFFFVRSNIFRIQSVEVKAEKISCADTYQIRETSALLEKHILFFDQAGIRNTLKNEFVCIKDVKILRRFPNHINLVIIGREPKAVLINFKEKEASLSADIENIATPSARAQETVRYLVDDESIIFSKDPADSNLTKIYYQGELHLGETLKILDKIKIYGLDVSESEILDNTLVIYPQRIIFNLSADVDAQLASLQLILNKAKIDNESLRFVDLRFDKPVIKIAPKKK